MNDVARMGRRSRHLAGVECLADIDEAPGKGCLNSRNLTPDATGLASRTCPTGPITT